MNKDKIKITVTEDDIENGIKKNTSFCPIAKAIQRTFNDIRPFVYEDLISLIKTDGGRVRYKPSRAASRFVNKFDRTGKGKPFSFIATRLDYQNV